MALTTRILSCYGAKMIYEKETYRRYAPPPSTNFQIVDLETGITYPTLKSAAQAAGVSLYKMRRFVADGTAWKRPHGAIRTKKKVRCVTTGKVFNSVAEAFKSIPHRSSGRLRKGSNIGTLYAHLSGALPSVRGMRFEYAGDAPPQRKKRKSKAVPPDTSPVRDDAGQAYKGVNHVARVTGLTRRDVVERVRLDPEGVFRMAWVNDATFRTARHDGKLWWVNGTIPVDTFRKFQTVLRLMGKRVTAGEARRLAGDLFA